MTDVPHEQIKYVLFKKGKTYNCLFGELSNKKKFLEVAFRFSAL